MADAAGSQPDTVVLPDSRITMTMKAAATGREKYEATQAMLGDAFLVVIDPEAPPANRRKVIDRGWNSRQRLTRYLGYVAVSLITWWDALDEKGDPRPITFRSLEAIQSETDYELLLEAVGARIFIGAPEADKGADDPFSTPSEPSSSDTSSPTPVSSPGN